MKKLSLIIPALLGLTVATTSVEAASVSDLKPYQQNITMSVNTKIYNDSKLKASKTTKQGTVYKANGYRIINGQKYYRVYQSKYKGYVKASQTKVLTAKKVNTRYFLNINSAYNMWGNLYFDKQKGQLTPYSNNTVYYVKYRYDLPNGRSYFSVYDDQKRDQWLGYMNDDAYRALKQEKYTKYGRLNLKSSVTAFKDFNGTKVSKHLTSKNTKYVYPKYQYRLKSLTLLSVYEYDELCGKEKWLGYVSESALTPYVNKSQLDYQASLLHVANEVVIQASDALKQTKSYTLLCQEIKYTKQVMNSKETVDQWYKNTIFLSGRTSNAVNENK